MTGLADGLDAAGQAALARIRATIVKADPSVVEREGAVMSTADGIVYEQSGIFKYALARTKKGITFHSMVMYGHGDVADFVRTRFAGAKLQKGCFNVAGLEDLDTEAFTEMMALSAAKDFQPVIDHYKKKKPR